MVCGLFTHHDGRPVGIAIGHAREDRAVGHPQSRDTDHPGFRINHGHGIARIAHLAGPAGVIGAFCVFTNDGIKLCVALDGIARLDFLAAIRIKGRLGKDFAGEANAGTEILPVLGVGHVIECNPGVVVGIGGTERDLPARLGSHRTDMGLIAMPIGDDLAVIADRDGQEVVLDVGVFDACSGADKPGAFELVGRAKAGFPKHPLQPDLHFAADVPVGKQRDRLGCGLLDVEFQMILQVLADAGAVCDNLYPVFAQMRGGTNARKHKKLGGIER